MRSTKTRHTYVEASSYVCRSLIERMSKPQHTYVYFLFIPYPNSDSQPSTFYIIHYLP